MHQIQQLTETTTEAERGLIGALMLSPNLIDEVAGDLSGADFADADLGKLFEALAIAREAGIPITDVNVLVSELRQQRVPASVSSTAFLARLVTDAVAANAPHYATIIKNGSLKRQWCAIGHELVRRAADRSTTPNGIAEWAESRIATVGFQGGTKVRMIGSIADEIIADLRTTREQQRILMTGIESLDTTVGGWHGGEMIVLAARPGMGKTALALQIAEYTASRGRPTLFVSLEMRDRELVTRMLCAHAGVDSRVLRTGTHGEDSMTRLCHAREMVRDFPLLIWDAPRATMSQIRAIARREASRHDLQLIVVDYIGRVIPENPRAKRHEQVSDISRGMKSLARELDVPVLVLVQLNRESTRCQRPQLSHLAESGSIEQDADGVMFIHRGDASEKESELIVAKHRHSCTGRIELEWRGSQTRFIG